MKEIQLDVNKDIIITPKQIEKKKCSTKKKIIIIISCVLLFILILILILIFLPVPGHCCLPPPKCANPPCNDPSPEINEEKVINLYYKKNDILLYNEIQTKISNIEFNENIKDEENIISQKSIINSEYLINIYDNEINNSTKIYYAYATIINMKKQIENIKIEDMGGNDIRNNNISYSIPISKFSFNENGKILSFKMNENMNETLASYLYEFIEKVIPEISNSSFNDTEKNEDRSNGKIYYQKPNLNNENNEEKYWEISIKDNKVINV